MTFYIHDLLHTWFSTHITSCTHDLVHTTQSTHRKFYTHDLPHTSHPSTHDLPHTSHSTHMNFYTQSIGHVIFCTHDLPHTSHPTHPPAPMNHVKIFKGWPPRDAPSKLVQLWYKTFAPDQRGQAEMKKPTRLSNKASTAWSCADDQILENKNPRNMILNICTER